MSGSMNNAKQEEVPPIPTPAPAPDKDLLELTDTQGEEVCDGGGGDGGGSGGGGVGEDGEGKGGGGGGGGEDGGGEEGGAAGEDGVGRGEGRAGGVPSAEGGEEDHTKGDTQEESSASSSDSDEEEDDTCLEATLRFRVEEFSKLNYPMKSPPCSVHGLPWKIMVRPDFNSNTPYEPLKKHLGFFVECNGESRSTTWSCNAVVDLRLLSVKEGQEPFTREFLHLFHSKTGPWGFPNFMAWDDVLNPENGYIKDDAITLEIWLAADPPEGVSSDSKRHLLHERLKKETITCFMNSFLETENKKLKAENEEMKVDCRALREEDEKINKRLQELEKENEEMKVDCRALKEENEKINKMLQELGKENEEMKVECRTLRGGYEKINEKLQELEKRK